MKEENLSAHVQAVYVMQLVRYSIIAVLYRTAVLELRKIAA